MKGSYAYVKGHRSMEREIKGPYAYAKTIKMS